MPIKISILSLGCARNLVDSEVISGILKDAGYKVTDTPEGADVAVVNTCAFIEDAKKESIDAILDLIDLKKRDKVKRILVAGCLPQRYKAGLREQLEEIDGFIGTDNFKDLKKIIGSLLKGERIYSVTRRPKYLYDENTPRISLTPGHYAYIKISEGCSHKCSFCVIPCVRGPHRSRRIESVVKEAERLIKNGAKEIDIIGQDTTLYGVDIYGRLRSADLLKRLSRLKNAKWIRLLYTHPAHFTDELISVIAAEKQICKYIDIPVQHISDRILKRMNRGTSKRSILRLLEKLRKRIPGAALRTAVIVGFPGETRKEFSELIDFIKEQKFERLGAFAYSREEGTKAYSFPGQVTEKEKKSRWNKVMRTQQTISLQNNQRFIGKELEVLIDEKDRNEPNLYLGRSYMDAPEIDGTVYVKTSPLPRGERDRVRGQKVRIGEFVRVKIIDAYEYDLVGDAL